MGGPPAVDAAWAGSPCEALAVFLSAIHGGSPPGPAAALASLSAARLLAAELERGELSLIEAARAGGASWSEISAALGARDRQTAQNATPTSPSGARRAETASPAGEGHPPWAAGRSLPRSPGVRAVADGEAGPSPTGKAAAPGDWRAGAAHAPRLTRPRRVS
jgi:hypothetical protein